MMCYTIGDKAKVEHAISNGAQRLPFPPNESPREEKDVTTTPRKTPTDDPTTTQARELIRFFFKLFHDTDAIDFSPRSLLRAADLITKHGATRVRYIIEFAHKTASEIHYQPQTFEGILHYTDRALADYQRNERRKHEHDTQREKEREERRKEHYTLYEREELERFKATMPPHALEAIRDQAKNDLIENGLNPDTDITFNIRVLVKVNQLLTEKADLLTYDQWKEQGRETPTP